MSRIDWWHEAREKLDKVGRLCVEHKKAAMFHKEGGVTIYPEEVKLESVDEALNYLEPGQSLIVR